MAVHSFMFDPPEGSLKSAIGWGIYSTAAAQAIKLVMQILSVVVLARLLTPQDFGVVAMAGPVVAFLGMFQNLGLSQATIQRKTLEHHDVNFLFWINVVASLAVALAVAAISPLAIQFYKEPQVGPLIAAMSLPILISGIGAQHSALMNRRMDFRRLALIDVCTGGVSLAAAFIWAIVAPSYWALWASNLVGAVFGTACVWIFMPWRPSSPSRASDGAGLSMVGFGAGLTGFNFANFFARNLDQILIGRYRGGVELGLYDRAYKLLLFPLSQITNPLSKVMVPALSRMIDEPDRYSAAYTRVVRLLLLAALPGVAWSIGMADKVVPFLLGEKFAESAPIFAALGMAGLLQPMNNPTGWLFISQGRGREFFVWGIVTACFAVIAFGVGIFWGAWGIATAYAVQEYLKTPVLWWYIGRRGPVKTKDLIASGIPFVAAAHIALVGVWLVVPILPDGYVGLVVGLVASYALSLAVSALFSQGRMALIDVIKIGLRKA